MLAVVWDRQRGTFRRSLSDLTKDTRKTRIAFETNLGKNTRAVLESLNANSGVLRADRLALIADEQQRIRGVCTTIEFFMCHLMRWRKGWTHRRWFDGIYADQVIVRPDQLEFFGEALCAAGQHKFWLEPFFASVTLVENTGRLQSYLFALGDAEIGVRKKPYEALRRMKSRVPSRWLFVLDEKPHIAVDN